MHNHLHGVVKVEIEAVKHEEREERNPKSYQTLEIIVTDKDQATHTISIYSEAEILHIKFPPQVDPDETHAIPIDGELFQSLLEKRKKDMNEFNPDECIMCGKEGPDAIYMHRPAHKHCVEEFMQDLGTNSV